MKIIFEITRLSGGVGVSTVCDGSPKDVAERAVAIAIVEGAAAAVRMTAKTRAVPGMTGQVDTYEGEAAKKAVQFFADEAAKKAEGGE